MSLGERVKHLEVISQKYYKNTAKNHKIDSKIDPRRNILQL